MNFPSRPPKKIINKELIEEAIGVEVEEFYENRVGLAVVANEEIVTNLSPSMDKISKMDYIGLIVTSRGENVDFVSRFFARQIGVPEDPVTGSAHCELIPLWAEKLNKNKLIAKQLSSREGTLYCEYLNCKNCNMTTSGTNAIILALMALDLNTGDEVSVPNYTMLDEGDTVIVHLVTSNVHLCEQDTARVMFITD